MSRYTLPHPLWEVSVGWDPAMNTFFLQAHELPVGEGDLVHWIGRNHGAETLLGPFLRAARSLGIAIPSTFRRQLAEDSTESS